MRKTDSEHSFKRRRSSPKRRQSSMESPKTLLLLSLVAVALVGVVVLLLSKESITEQLHRLQALRLEKENTKNQSTYVNEIPLGKDPREPAPSPRPLAPPAQPAPAAPEALPAAQSASPAVSPQAAPAAESTPSAAAAATEPAPVAPTPPENPLSPVKKRKYPLYFLKMEGDSFQLEPVFRLIEFTDSPLTATLEQLINGPLATELKNSPTLISAIPSGTKIRSVNLKNGIAFVDLNTEFVFNPIAKEGLSASVKQIVRTATAFPTVHAVQFLINGTVRKYLSSEGIEIDHPLSEADC